VRSTIFSERFGLVEVFLIPFQLLIELSSSRSVAKLLYLIIYSNKPDIIAWQIRDDNSLIIIR